MEPIPHSFQIPLNYKRSTEHFVAGSSFLSRSASLSSQAHSITNLVLPSYTGQKRPWLDSLPPCFRIVTSHRVLSLLESLSDLCFLIPLFTVNSKAEVRFHLATAEWIAEPVRQKMAIMVGNHRLLFL